MEQVGFEEVAFYCSPATVDGSACPPKRGRGEDTRLCTSSFRARLLVFSQVGLLVSFLAHAIHDSG